jgi:oligopeptide transport system permease protein
MSDQTRSTSPTSDRPEADPDAAGPEADPSAAEPEADVPAAEPEGDPASAGPPTPEPGGPSEPGESNGVDRVGSLASDAWRNLRRNPMFLISTALILLFIIMAVAPGLFTRTDPLANDLSLSRQPPSAQAWFGYDVQGRDVFARTIYGARASIVVGVLATLGTVLFGSILGIIAGYYGRLTDALLSRFGEIFMGLPFFLGAIVILTTFNPPGSNTSSVRIMFLVIATLVTLGWPVSMRIMRSAVIAAKEADYVLAARALGAGTLRIVLRHLLPNTLAPVLVYATLTVGAFIGAEATLSYLGIGLTPPVISWGVAISDASNYVRVSPHLLLFPAAFLTTTVLAFVLLGEAVREALDPKLR